jgi:hypothetical protein
MQNETTAAVNADAIAAEGRWAAWMARGVEQDRKADKRAMVAAVVVASGLGLWLAMVLFG